MSCISCQLARATIQEEKCPQNIFCNESCQASFHKIELKADKDEAGPAIDDTNIIGLESSDGRKFRITRQQAQHLKRLDSALNYKNDETYFKTTIRSKELQMIVDFLNGKMRLFNGAECLDLLAACAYFEYQSLYEFLLPTLIKRLHLSNQVLLDSLKDGVKKAIIYDALYFMSDASEFSHMSYAWDLISRYPFKRLIKRLGTPDPHIIVAIMDEKHTIVRIMLDTLSFSAGEFDDILLIAVTYMDVTTVRTLLSYPSERGINPAPLATGLFRYMRRQNQPEAFEIVKLFLARKDVDPAANDNELIIDAARYNVQVLDLLLKLPPWKNVRPNARDNSPIWAAVQLSNVDSVRLLLNSKRVDPSGAKVIIEAGKQGNVEIIQLLAMDTRVNLSTQDNTPIKFAIQNAHYEAVLMLLKLGVNPTFDMLISTIDNLQRDDLPYEVREYSQILVALLQDGRIDPTSNNNEALFSSLTSASVLDILLRDKRVDPSAQDNYAIKFAVQTDLLDIVEVLLADSRVDPSVNENWCLKQLSERIFNGKIKDRQHVSYLMLEKFLQSGRVDPNVLADYDHPLIRELYEKYRTKKQRIKGYLQ